MVRHWVGAGLGALLGFKLSLPVSLAPGVCRYLAFGACGSRCDTALKAVGCWLILTKKNMVSLIIPDI